MSQRPDVVSQFECPHCHAVYEEAPNQRPARHNDDVLCDACGHAMPTACPSFKLVDLPE